MLREARQLGAVQLGLSGGEPLARDDLEIIVAEAHSLGYYINLITSGIGLTEARIAALKAAGLDHIQLSFQDSTREVNDFLSSTRTFELKSKVAALIKKYEYPMVLNVVLHRLNIDHVEQILQMARNHAGASTWSLPTPSITAGRGTTANGCCPAANSCGMPRKSPTAFRQKSDGRMKIFFVVPDYSNAARNRA